MSAPVKLFFASSNAAKLAEYRALAFSAKQNAQLPIVEIEPLPNFSSLPPFEESYSTFGENALGKAIYYSQLSQGPVFADDSGLVVSALGGAPGVQSARYAGAHATSADRIAKLARELAAKPAGQRAAYFCCVIALVRSGQPISIISSRTDGEILLTPRGENGFGYDPVFYFPPLAQTFAELSPGEKNLHSHRGKAFRRLISLLR